ncbi:MAG: aminotransferase class III-fold pyridoxal phosphate-dependent enzyme [Alphaproteobacteria bacterium]|nr:aminotransferase class III-fold pyridoxal phosphate-dependent enzyme [Alphaproteobacteria bacterium]
MAAANYYEAARSTNVSPEDAALIARRKKVLGPAYRLFYENPVHIVRGEGVWLYGPHGEAYLDVYNNVACVGHSNPHVVDAIARQAAILNTHTRYLTEGVLAYAERLLATFPQDLSQVMFACTGSEANDLAVRVAKAYTGGTGFIVTSLAYHGTTEAIATMSPSLGQHVKLNEHVRTVPAPDTYRTAPEAISKVFAAHVRAALADMKANGIKPAALLADMLFTSDGVYPDPKGFLAEAVAAVREAGGILIADEVQSGFARSGDAMWGFLRHGLDPELVTMGKPMGNGHPISAMVGRPGVVDAFARTSRYFNTFAGNPVSCAAGMAVLDVLTEQKLLENARDVGAYMKAGIAGLAEKHAVIGDVRGAGLFLGVELVNDRKTKEPASEVCTRVVNGLREKRVLISSTGPDVNILKIRPPLVFSRANADQFLSALDDVLSTL